MKYNAKSILGMACLLVLLVVSASCKSDQSNSSVARVDESSDTATSSTTENNAEDEDLTNEEIVTRFSACMRDQGFDTADPELNADGTVNLGALKESIAQDPNYDPKSKSGKSASALEDCVPLLAGATFTKEASPEDEIGLQDNLLAFAQCLRDEGLDVSDPDFSGDGQFSKDFISNIKGAESRVQSSIDLCSERIFGGGESGK